MSLTIYNAVIWKLTTTSWSRILFGQLNQFPKWTPNCVNIGNGWVSRRQIFWVQLCLSTVTNIGEGSRPLNFFLLLQWSIYTIACTFFTQQSFELKIIYIKSYFVTIYLSIYVRLSHPGRLDRFGWSTARSFPDFSGKTVGGGFDWPLTSGTLAPGSGMRLVFGFGFELLFVLLWTLACGWRLHWPLGGVGGSKYDSAVWLHIWMPQGLGLQAGMF